MPGRLPRAFSLGYARRCYTGSMKSPTSGPKQPSYRLQWLLRLPPVIAQPEPAADSEDVGLVVACRASRKVSWLWREAGRACCFHEHARAAHRVSGSLIARRIAAPRRSRRNGSSSGSFAKL